MFKNWDWEDTWLALLWTAAASLLIVFLFFCFTKKPTIRYSLDESDGKLSITKEIEWCGDDNIRLDRNVTYWEAIRMVDSLNATLKH